MCNASCHATGTSAKPKRISYRRLLRISRRLSRLYRRRLGRFAHCSLSGGHDVRWFFSFTSQSKSGKKDEFSLDYLKLSCSMSIN
jgi:hypothetical protein